MDPANAAIALAAKSATTAQIITGVGVGAFLGAVLAALLTQWMTNRRENKNRHIQRKGLARVLYQDFLRQQSTLARAFYRGDWWRREELLPLQVDNEDVKLLATELERTHWDGVARSLGWMAYLRKLRSTATEPLRDHETRTLVTVYRYLDLGRYALSTYSEMPYEPHRNDEMRATAVSRGELVESPERIAFGSLSGVDAEAELVSLAEGEVEPITSSSA